MYAEWASLLITVAAIAVAVLIFKAGHWVNAVDADRAQFRDFMQEVRDEFGAFRKEIRDEFHAFRQEMRDEFHGYLEEVRKDIRGIRGDFRENLEISRKIHEDAAEIKAALARLPSAAVSDSSPLHLTDIGESISATLRAREWAERTAAALGERVKGKRPYVVQDLSFEYVKREFKPTEEQEVEIRTCAYEKGLKRDIVLDVLAVELRDALLKAA